MYDGLDYIQDQEEHLGLKARIVREIANVYGQTENYAQADTFYAEAQELSRLVGNQKDIIFILHNRGLMNLRQGQVDTANIFAREALELAKTYQQQDGIGYAYRLLGEVYGIGYVQPREALGYLNQAYEIFLANDDQQSLTEVYFEMGRNYTALAQFTKADSLLNLAKDNAEKLDNPYSLLEVYRIYRDLEEARLNYQVSLQYYKLSEVLRDSLRGYNQYWQIAKQQTDLKTKELGQEIAEFEGRTRLQKSILILVSVFAFGLAVLLGVIYRINRQRNLTNAKLREQNDEIEAYNVELSQKNEEIAAQADWLRDSNDQIKKQTDELSKLNRMKDRMLSVISHDFRSPLNSLRGALMLLNSQQLPPDQLQMVTDDINNKLNRTLNLVDNLLQWTRNQLMGVEVNRQQLNMHDLGDETFNLLQPLAEGKRITLVNHIAEDTTIDADLEMMKVVLRNLVSNAIKFTLKGGEVRVESKIEDHYLSISVIDTGIGMTPDKVDRLFELGTDRSSLGTANEKGTGIGLLLCKEFIEKHGGHIHVISIEEKGSTFTFSLPLRAASRSQMELETVS
ncbi:MAG: tetratricopeptide repeat-containing sensor histidine kinase [Bacteroidota bacterium]